MKAGKRPLQKAGVKVPAWGGNHNLPVNMLEMSSSLFPLKHKHFHIYSVCEPPKPLTIPPRSTTQRYAHVQKLKQKDTQFKK